MTEIEPVNQPPERLEVLDSGGIDPLEALAIWVIMRKSFVLAWTSKPHILFL